MRIVRQVVALCCVCQLWAVAPVCAQDSPTAAHPPLTEGSSTAYTLPAVTTYGVADQAPSVPVTTRFGTQYNVVTEEQISRQNSLDFYDALRNVPGVMYQKKNIVGGQTSHSLYIRGRGASHPSPDLNIFFDDVPRSGVLFGQALADGIPVFALGGMEIYKSPQPYRFGSGYGMINFIPKFMTEEGTEVRLGFEGGSFGTFAENVGVGAKKDGVDIYAAQSHISTMGHEEHSAAYQNSYYANMGIQVYENWSVRLLANRVDAQTQAPNGPLTGTRSIDRFETETSLATLSLANQYENAKGYLKGYYNNTLFHLRAADTAKPSMSTQTNNLYGLRGRETFSLWQGNEFVAGFDLDATQLKNYEEKYGKKGTTDTTWNFPDQTLFSPYLAISQFFGEKEGFHVTPSAGIRLYEHNVFASDIAAPQAGVVLGYHNTNLNFSYARGVNYPSPVIFLGLLPNKSLPSGLNTQDIKPEIVDHYEVGLSHTWPKLFTLSATYFHDDGRDRFRAYMGGKQNPTADFFTSRTAEYKIDGFELGGSLTPIENLELFAGATWLHAQAKGDKGTTQDHMPYTPSFALQAGFTWKFLEHFQLSGDYQYLHDVYAATSMRSADVRKPSSTFAELNSVDKLPDISVANVRLDYIFSYDDLKIEQGKVFIAVNNLFDNKYAYALEKNRAGTDRCLYNMPGINFMAGFEVKF
ncbi:MAG: TonB-dependent receptor [Desulfovibrionaceae bacterium]